MPKGVFIIGGFSDIRSGNRDYGMGIVRVDPRFLAGDATAAGWPRHALVRLISFAGSRKKSLYAILRPIHPQDLPPNQTKHLLCLEYDDRLVLGVQKEQEIELTIDRAGIVGQYMYFRGHPNIIVRAYLRYAFLTSLLTTMLAVVAWTVLRKLG